MDGRTITKKQMRELAWAYFHHGNGSAFRSDNPNVFWETEVDHNRSFVTIRANYMQVLHLSRSMLLLVCKLKGISL